MIRLAVQPVGYGAARIVLFYDPIACVAIKQVPGPAVDLFHLFTRIPLRIHFART